MSALHAEADWLEDFGTPDGGDEATRRAAVGKDIERARAARFQTGYREGMQDARGDEQCLQAGFDAGFADAAPIARLRGRVRGVLQIVSALLEKGDLVHAVSASGRPVTGWNLQLMAIASTLAALRWPTVDALDEAEAQVVVDGIVTEGAVADGVGNNLELETAGVETARAEELGPHAMHVAGTEIGQWLPAARRVAIVQLKALVPLICEAEQALRHLLCGPLKTTASNNEGLSRTSSTRPDETISAEQLELVVRITEDCRKECEALLLRLASETEMPKSS